MGTLTFARTVGEVLVAGGPLGFTGTLWRSDDLRRHACAGLTRRTLSDAEWSTFVGVGEPRSGCPSKSANQTVLIKQSRFNRRLTGRPYQQLHPWNQVEPSNFR